MNDQLEVTLANKGSEVARMQGQLEVFAKRYGLAAYLLHKVQLALEEHLTNIVSYGYADKLEHQIKVRIQLNAYELRIQVEDDGHAFNPLEQPAPELSKPIEERPIGGLGIHMMRKSLDKIEYRRADEKNILVMIKHI